MSFCRIFKRDIYRLILQDVFHSSILPSRSTFIVKRVNPVPLSRLTAPRPRILKARHFVYETVEDTDLTEAPDIQVVLTSFVDGIGDVGDVISVQAEFGRNSLLLPRKALYATPENIEKYGVIKKTRPERSKYSSIHSGVTMRCLSKMAIPVYMNSQEPWVIENNHVQVAFRNEGYCVPLNAIEMPSNPIEGPDESKEAKDFAVYVTINNTERIPVRCKLFHIKLGFETAKLSEEYYTEKGDPILDDQKELLDSMPKPELLTDPNQNISLVERYRIQYIK
ncbi:39S ribosomal protein L9, mitochondrial-like [Uloborus diversus]|uniref:39S ribosomal protein L9, mitochondrial-like n=1 Tax=Uloborus diversus TaxID=327109 RepID=UPI002409F28A|nr:39S ribosomal protein L9, mitochondrial-like [Uloborus diversus]